MATAVFEWINVQDQDTTSRAKSHVRRELKRRQRAEGLRFQRLKEGSGHKLLLAGSSSQPEEDERTDNDGIVDLKVDTAASPPSHLIFILNGTPEPFNAMPAKLDSNKDLLLINHYHKVFAPKPFELANNWDYTPFRIVTLDLAMQDPAAFLLVAAGAATDLAMRQKSKFAPDAFEYRAKAMKMVNRRMMIPRQSISDGAITCCVVLAGLEILWGNPETYNIHMDGLIRMIELRGGFAVLQASNPVLTSLIAWHDYAGAAALISKRRFEFLSSPLPPKDQPTKPRRYMPPLNGPFSNLPPNYTLYEDLMIILDELQHTPSIIRTSKFVIRLNEELGRMIDDSSKQSVPFRRFLIEDSFRLAALIYISGLSTKETEGQSEREIFLQRLQLKLFDSTKGWGHHIALIVKLLMEGGDVNSEENVYNVLQLMDFFITLSWRHWKLTRDTLLYFFLHDEKCAGPLQEFWVLKTGMQGEPNQTPWDSTGVL